MKKVKLDSEYITLGQFLKWMNIIQTGGMAKWFLQNHEVRVNGELEIRRGRKLRNGDEIEIVGYKTFKIE